MNYLASFLPWIGFAVVSTQADWRWSALVGLVVALAAVVLQRRRGRALDALIVEVSALVFFVLLTGYALAVPDSPLRPVVGALSDGWLALTAWGSLALRRPFTLGIAKLQTPREVWATPRFRRINVVITTVWAVSFTVAGVAATVLLAAAPHATGALVAIDVLGFAVPILFTVRYVAHARAQAPKAA